MKKIVITTLLFVAVLKITDITCYHLLQKIYKNTYAGQEGGDLNRYLNDPQAPGLVLLGPSTTKMQVCPDSFSMPTCNLGRASTTESYQLGLLLLMIKNHKTPKCILLGIEPKYYALGTDKDEQPEDLLYLKNYYGEIPYIENEINNISFFEKYKFLVSCTKFNGYVFHTLKNYYRSQKEKSGKYFFKYLPVNPSDSANIVAYNNIHPPKKVIQSLPLSPKIISYLPAFIDTCKKYKIKLICFSPPSLHYREDSLRLSNAYIYTNQMLKEKNIPYFAFTPQNSPDLFNRLSYWSDGRHLNETGSSILSAQLAKFTEANYSNPSFCYKQQ